MSNEAQTSPLSPDESQTLLKKKAQHSAVAAGALQLRYQDRRILPLIVLLLFLIFINSAATGIPTGFFPQLVTDPNGEFKLSSSQLGLISSLYSLAMAVGSPLTSHLATFKCTGNLVIILLGMVLLSLATFFTAYSVTVFQFAITKFVSGLSVAFINVAAMSIFIKNTDNLVDLVGLEKFVIGFAYVLSYYGGSWVFVHIGYFWTFASSGIVLASCTVFAFICVAYSFRDNWSRFDFHEGRSSKVLEPQEDDDEDAELGSPVTLTQGVLTGRELLGLFGSAEMMVCIICCLETFLVMGANSIITGIHYQKSLDLSDEAVGLMFSAMALLFSVTAFFVGPLGTRFGYKSGFVFGCFSKAVAYLLLGPAPFLDRFVSSRVTTWILTLTSLFLYSVGVAFGHIPFIPLCKNILQKKLQQMPSVDEKDRDKVISMLVSPLYNFIYGCGMFLGPLLGGLLMDWVPKRGEVTCMLSNSSCLSGMQWTTFILAILTFGCGCFALFAISSDKPHSKKQNNLFES
eukprot:TRINITY_DN14280_c1_g3_i2.p1 TRINITY_DN14280_c1_g3~~TRINITY_DN14280_c1_g3_i2.p1  ORF type:complete len:516 (+),score=112.64 TRINITY_DN14280_c1_g3_i2:772-2319(+)